jgi:hypothetical protein
MLNALKEFATQMRGLLWPEKYFAWQTLLMLSLFSWLVAIALDALAIDNPQAPIDSPNSLLVRFLSTLSWIFLTSAIWWALSENKVKAWGFSISPWITGAVLCLFAFNPWQEADRFRWALSSWPLISVAIAFLPSFFSWELEFSVPKKDKRPALVMTLLINLLLTSWLLFFFRVQDWVNNYPSLLVSKLGNSAFVYDFVAERDPDTYAQGIPLLESTVAAIAGELNEQPWYQTERWLYTRKGRLEDIALRMNNNLEAPDEKIFWLIDVPEPKRLGEGYLLKLRADWLGPVAGDRSFHVEKSCKITPSDKPRSVPTTAASSNPKSSPNSSTVSPEAAAAARRNQQNIQFSKVTVVDCGEDAATVLWN